MWRTKIQALTKSATFKNSASDLAIENLEKALSVALPSELRDLLCESDGVEGEYGLGLVWNCERILKDNLEFRSSSSFVELYMPFQPLLFFGDAGNGDQFAFAIRSGRISRSDVYAWNHENDSRAWVAPSLEKYLEWWLTGKLKI